MSTSDYQRFIGGSQDKGINTFEPDIGAEITWDETTVNVTGGIRRGVGPRPGISPLPGHADTETLAGTNTNGLMKSESSGGVGLINRDLLFGIVPVTIAPYAGSYPKAPLQYFVWLVGLDFGANYCLDACFGATLASAVNSQSSSIRAGLAQSSYQAESPLVRRHKTELINLPTQSTPTAADMQAQLKGVTGRYWTPYAQISISGKRIPYNWMLSAAQSIPSITVAPLLNLWDVVLTVGTSPSCRGGIPSEIETRDAPDNVERVAAFYCLLQTGYKIDMKYTKSITKANTVAGSAYNNASLHYSPLSGAAKTGASVLYSSVFSVLVNDPGSFTNTKHEAIIVAGERPIAIVYQDWLKAVKGMMPRFFDLSAPPLIPRVFLSQSDGSQSVFPAAVPQAGSANSGVLRANTTYDFGMSLYHKQYDYETNVGQGASLTTGVGDFVSVNFDQLTAGQNVWNLLQTSAGTFLHAFPWEFSPTAPRSGNEVGRDFHINDIEYRIYYRQSGTAEWLPGGNVDASKYWFFTEWPTVGGNIGPAFCTGPSGSLPGGYANGFIDYSPLPTQRYLCAISYKGRAFWWSEKSMHYSIQGNIYAYPTRNIVAAPTGSWRGGIVHIQPGETVQTSRLVVFGSDNAFAGRFTGYLSKQNVRISSDTVGQFDIEGSDFELDYLCDATAYSYRAACVAEGILYFWGDQGVYRDDGISQPEKISQILEPDVFDLVNHLRISEVHSIYNKRTKEIYWFFPPKTADATYPTYGLVYNVMNQRFSYVKFLCQIDSAQILKDNSQLTPAALAGERIVIMARATAAATTQQRGYYFDELCRAGEMVPGTELMIKTISTPVAGTRRLTIASGSVAPSASIVAGDFVSFQNAQSYAPALAAGSDMVALVTAVTATTLDITLPTSGDIDAAATLTQGNALPIWHKAAAAKGLHGITYQIQTNYWLPTGVVDAWYWRYLYLLFKYSGWPSPTGAQIALAWRVLRCGGFVGDTLTLSNNSDGHCQVLHALKHDARSSNGQALKFKLSGIHIGDQWTLEYLEAHCTREKGFTLKEFEG